MVIVDSEEEAVRKHLEAGFGNERIDGEIDKDPADQSVGR